MYVLVSSVQTSVEIVHITLKGGRVAVCMDYFLASLCFIDLAILLLVKVQCVWVGIWWVIFRYMGWLVDIEVLTLSRTEGVNLTRTFFQCLSQLNGLT